MHSTSLGSTRVAPRAPGRADRLRLGFVWACHLTDLSPYEGAQRPTPAGVDQRERGASMDPERLDALASQVGDQVAEDVAEYIDGLSARARADLGGGRNRLAVLVEGELGARLDPSLAEKGAERIGEELRNDRRLHTSCGLRLGPRKIAVAVLPPANCRPRMGGPGGGRSGEGRPERRPLSPADFPAISRHTPASRAGRRLAGRRVIPTSPPSARMPGASFASAAPRSASPGAPGYSPRRRKSDRWPC